MFIIIISILILGLIIILLIYWCCKPNREQEIEQKEKITHIEKSADVLEKEIAKTSYCIEDLQKSVSKLEKTVENSDVVHLNTQKTQVRIEAEQERIKEDSHKIDEALNNIHDKIRKDFSLQENGLKILMYTLQVSRKELY